MSSQQEISRRQFFISTAAVSGALVLGFYIPSRTAQALGHVSRKRDVALGPMTVRAVATYDGPSFSAIDLEVAFDDQPPPGIGELVERASKVCYLSNTLARRPRVTVTVAP